VEENKHLKIYQRHVIVSREEYPEDMDLMIEWCQENCQYDWAYGLQHTGPDGSIEYAFYFYDKNECFGFSLAWGLD
jgi:hypothetical protein